MPVHTLLSADGKIDASVFRKIHFDADHSLSVVAVLAAYGLDHAALLDDLLNTTFSSVSPVNPPLASLAVVPGDDSSVLIEPPRHLAVINAEPFDRPHTERDDMRELCWHFALALSHVVLLPLRLRDVSRPRANGLAALQASLTQALMLQADGVVSAPEGAAAAAPRGRRTLLVVVVDFEGDVASSDDVVAALTTDLQELYVAAAKPARSPARVTDVFDVEVALLPPRQADAAAHRSAVDKLRDRLCDPADDDYVFEGAASVLGQSGGGGGGSGGDDADGENGPGMRAAKTAEAVWKKMEERVQDMPPKKDLMSAFDCNSAMRKVYDKYERGVRVWRREAEGGVIVDGFGAAAADMVKKTLTVYDADAAPHKGSKAFRRKRDELRDLLDADLYSLFVVQIGRLREMTFRAFKTTLGGIDEGEARPDRKVQAALKEAQREFRGNAEALRPKGSRWRFDSDEKQLGEEMQEAATDKLQRVRIAEYQENGGRRGRRSRGMEAAGTKRRQPISVGFHYLDPAPFGWKDSRYEKLNVDDSMEFGEAQGEGVSGLLAPPRDSGWARKNQEFIYSERK